MTQAEPDRSTALVTNVGYATDIGLRLRPEAPALIQHGLQRTFRELDGLANQVANRLADDGVVADERVFVLFENDIRYFEVLLGAMRIGAVPVPVSTKLNEPSLVAILADSGARTIITSPQFAAVAGRLLAEGHVDRAVAIAGPGGLPADVLDYDAWTASATTDRPSVEVDPDATAFQPYTSGTTGLPKGVLLTHRGWLHNCDLMRRVALMSGADRALCSNPLFHTNAMACGVFPAWLAGAGSVILPYFEPRMVIEAIEKWRCTFTTGVPAMYKLILNERELLSKHDVSSISFVSCGSAPMPATLLAELKEAFGGIDLMEGYGLTEGGPLISILPRFGKSRIGSIGLVLPETEVKICDPSGAEVTLGETGELWVRGPGVAKGYHNRPEATAARFVDGGWLRSGDLIRQDEEGFLYFIGRVDDRINVAGEHAYPSEIESILIKHPGVQDVCVVGRPHDIKGEVPVAFIVPAGEPPSYEELRDWFFERGPKFAHPREIIFIDALPLAATGKVDRRRLTHDVLPTPSQRPA